MVHGVESKGSVSLEGPVHEPAKLVGSDDAGRKFSLQNKVGIALLVGSLAIIAIGVVVAVLLRKQAIALPRPLTQELFTTPAIKVAIAGYDIAVRQYTMTGYSCSQVGGGLVSVGMAMLGLILSLKKDEDLSPASTSSAGIALTSVAIGGVSSTASSVIGELDEPAPPMPPKLASSRLGLLNPSSSELTASTGKGKAKPSVTVTSPAPGKGAKSPTPKVTPKVKPDALLDEIRNPKIKLKKTKIDLSASLPPSAKSPTPAPFADSLAGVLSSPAILRAVENASKKGTGPTVKTTVNPVSKQVTISTLPISDHGHVKDEEWGDK